MSDDDLKAQIAALETELAKLRKQLDEPKEERLLKVDEQQIAFGWGYVAKDEDGRQVVDWSGDVVRKAEELEKSAYNFVLTSRQGDSRHNGAPVATLVESLVITPEKLRAMGVPEGLLPSAGWWTGMKIHDPEVWEQVRSGELRSFSVGGRGVRIKI